jgi:hypothetical protein
MPRALQQGLDGGRPLPIHGRPDMILDDPVQMGGAIPPHVGNFQGHDFPEHNPKGVSVTTRIGGCGTEDFRGSVAQHIHVLRLGQGPGLRILAVLAALTKLTEFDDTLFGAKAHLFRSYVIDQLSVV